MKSVLKLKSSQYMRDLSCSCQFLLNKTLIIIDITITIRQFIRILYWCDGHCGGSARLGATKRTHENDKEFIAKCTLRYCWGYKQEHYISNKEITRSKTSYSYLELRIGIVVFANLSVFLCLSYNAPAWLQPNTLRETKQQLIIICMFDYISQYYLIVKSSI